MTDSSEYLEVLELNASINEAKRESRCAGDLQNAPELFMEKENQWNAQSKREIVDNPRETNRKGKTQNTKARVLFPE